MDNNFSVADALALRNNNNGGFMGGEAWIFFLFFLLAWGNGGMFGGNANNSAIQGALTRADLAQGFDFNNLNRQVLDINNSVNAIPCAIDKCCCTTAREIDSVKHEICNQTNALTNAIHSEGEATRALINANTMQNLRDENSALKFNISQQVQTKNILDNLGRYVTNEPCPQYPSCFNCNC